MTVFVGDLLSSRTRYRVELRRHGNQPARVLGICDNPEAAEHWRTTQAAALHLPIDHIRIRPVTVPAGPASMRGEPA